MSEQLPLISVAMCTYNGECFLAEQLESILNQTYPHLEVVIIDDCSTDGTAGIVQEYADRDERIRFLRNDSNLGFVKNFEKALQHCRGEFIALADQDDIWLPEKIEVLHREIGKGLLIYSAVRLMDAEGKPLAASFPKFKRLEGSAALSLLFDNCVTGHACLLRQELLQYVLPIPAHTSAHDHWIALVAAACGKLKASDKVLSWYRKHDNNALLGSRKTRIHPKLFKYRNKLSRQIQLIDALVNLGLCNEGDIHLLHQLRHLLERNRVVFYNFRLRKFLLQNQNTFLQLYNKPKRKVSKICRGYWYYRIVPFV